MKHAISKFMYFQIGDSKLGISISKIRPMSRITNIFVTVRSWNLSGAPQAITEVLAGMQDIHHSLLYGFKN